MSVAVVVPTIREECALRWLDEWKDDLRDARVILVEDNPEPTFAISGAEHYSWRDFAELGEDEWIIPRRTSACRSFGFLKALQGDADIIWTTDDDCYPEEARRGSYLDALRENVTCSVASADVMNGWWNTISSAGLYPRGYPYGIRDKTRPVMIHHGLWSGVPDLDGRTQLEMPGYRLPPAQWLDTVPYGRLFPMCGMSLAFRAEAAPLMYMLLMGQDHAGDRYPFDRFDDMWAGIMAKLACDHLGWAVTSGYPSVEHSRASDAARNAEIEAPGIAVHEDLWPYLKGVSLAGAKTAAECYLRFADAIEVFGGKPYWRELGEAMRRWTALTGDAN